jgi:hypothetical protein
MCHVTMLDGSQFPCEVEVSLFNIYGCSKQSNTRDQSPDPGQTPKYNCFWTLQIIWFNIGDRSQTRCLDSV